MGTALALALMEIESMGKGRVPGSMPDEREVTKGDEAARQPQRAGATRTCANRRIRRCTRPGPPVGFS